MNPGSILLRSLLFVSAVASMGSVAQAEEREAPPLREVQEIPHRRVV
jgi:hypothetical protein